MKSVNWCSKEKGRHPNTFGAAGEQEGTRQLEYILQGAGHCGEFAVSICFWPARVGGRTGTMSILRRGFENTLLTLRVSRAQRTACGVCRGFFH